MALCSRGRGTLNFLINGQSIKLAADGDITVITSDQARTALSDGEFTIEDRSPSITATVLVPNSIYVNDLQELCDAAVVVEMFDGRTFSTTSASNVSQEGYNPKTNQQPLELTAQAITELLPIAAA